VGKTYGSIGYPQRNAANMGVTELEIPKVSKKCDALETSAPLTEKDTVSYPKRPKSQTGMMLVFDVL
jgi:hypothetical protein